MTIRPGAWWINDQELAWHEAMIQADSDDWNQAVDTFHNSVERIPSREVRRRYNHLASLLNAQIHARACREASHTIERILPFVDEVGSTRTATTLLDSIKGFDARPSSGNAARQLRDGRDTKTPPVS
jgi:predicted transcriptional regulator of viral defense system